MKCCIVFADAFAYSTLCKIIRDGDFKGFYNYKLTPGIGYSSNLHHQIFSGKKPDEVGFFCDYSFLGPISKKINRFEKLMDEVDSFNVLYKVLGSKITKERINIPYSEKGAFHNTGKYLFKENGECEVFGRRVEKVMESQYKSELAFEKAKELVANNCDNLIVVLNELDHKGHIAGSSGQLYIEAAKKILNESKELFDLFQKKNENTLCLLISDHGMSDVHSSIDIVRTMYSKFGLPGEKYFYFNDSVYLRLWFVDEMIKCQMTDWLDRINSMEKISESDKLTYGVKNYNFGEAIYRLKEGYVFVPNCFSVSPHGAPAGMHGFMEHTDSASGIILCSEFLSNSKEISAIDIYDTIKERLM